MILFILAIVLGIFSVVFLLGAIIMACNVKCARTPRAKKALIRRCIWTIVLTVLCLAGTITMFILGYLPGARQRAIQGDAGYDLGKTYAKKLKDSDKEAAYAYLPNAVYAMDGTIAFANEQNDWFVYEETGSGKDAKMEWINRGQNTVRYATASLSGDVTMTVQLGMDGRLYLDGAFPYMKYDTNGVEYSGKIADDVKDFVCTGNSLFYLTHNNELYAFGLNDFGQLGDTSNRNKSEPVLIRSDVVQIASSATHTMVVDIFGNLYAVGDNSDSQLGDGTMTDSNEFIKIMSSVKQVAVGNYFSVILAQNGEVYTCGRATKGQCGNGDRNGTATPEKIGENGYKIAAGETTAAYMTAEGEVYVWGENAEHAFALDDTDFYNEPTLISEEAYDIAVSSEGLIILDQDRNIQVTGKLRSNTDELFNTVFDIDAQVPEDKKTRVQQDDKPDISELG